MLHTADLSTLLWKAFLIKNGLMNNPDMKLNFRILLKIGGELKYIFSWEKIENDNFF